MRKVDFLQAVQRIVAEIKAPELVSFLTPLVNRGTNIGISAESQEEFTTLLFESQGGYRDLMRNEQIAKIIKTLDMTRLFSPSNYSQLITVYKTAGQTGNIYNAGPSFALFFSLYDFLKWLLAFQSTFTEFLGSDASEKVPDGNKLLELEIFDFDDTGVDIQRIQELLSALEDLRMRISILLDLPESHLKVRYVESGTAIHINVEGLGEVIDALRKLFSEIWTRIMNRNFDRIDRRNASITGGFQLIDSIQLRIEAGSISHEAGELLKHQILDDAQKLFASGTTLQDSQAIQPVSKQKLLAEGLGIKQLGTGESTNPKI